jgi:Ca-activated chloride channel family protein
MLLSDGLANRGITDPRELSRIAAHERRHGISLSTVGVGLEYNENLMLALSERGGGNYYFLESSRDLASVLRNEFSRAADVLAQNAIIDIDLGLHVRVVDVVGCTFRTEGERLSLEVGDLYGGERREWTVVLDVPAGEGSRALARGSVRSQKTADGGFGETSETFAAEVRYTKEAAVVERNRDNEIQAKGDIALSTREVEQAMKALDEGRREEAMQRIDAARAAVAASPAVSVGGASADMLREQEVRLKGYNDLVKDSDEKKAKKEVQYDNYRTQKRK